MSSGLMEAVQPRSVSPSHAEEGQLDVEAVQAALRSFQQELKDAQRERVCHTYSIALALHTLKKYFIITSGFTPYPSF